MECLPGCTASGGECVNTTYGYGGNCFQFDPTDDTKRACYPACGTYRAPPCIMGLACEPYSQECGGLPPGGGMARANGAPCTRDVDCLSGRCLTEIDTTTMPGMPTPTGFLGGYCYSVSVQMPSTMYCMNDPVPQNGCPAGSGTVPDPSEHDADPTICWKTCTTDGDCRAGYRCDTLGGFFSDGVCRPVDCSQPGVSCPAGYLCVAAGGGHVCAAATR